MNLTKGKRCTHGKSVCLVRRFRKQIIERTATGRRRRYKIGYWLLGIKVSFSPAEFMEITILEDGKPLLMFCQHHQGDRGYLVLHTSPFQILLHGLPLYARCKFMSGHGQAVIEPCIVSTRAKPTRPAL